MTLPTSGATMLTLSLLRHAKSSWANLLLDDFDRPLAPRGEKAAPRMGALIAERNLIPDLILCSGAARTRQTLTLASANWPAQPPVAYEDALYHATVSALLSQIHRAPDDKRHLMLVGHNPGMQAVALLLVGGGEGADLRKLAHKFPSGALAVITFKHAHWRDIQPGDGHLTLFARPSDLPDAG
jgi:phosphohistidine phosphatase